jgi:flagellar hook-basal body complex protein FliE
MNFASILDNAEKTGLTADKAAGQLATGDLPNIQQFTSAAAKAELTVDLVVAIRNRAIDAYQEIMRMSV